MYSRKTEARSCYAGIYVGFLTLDQHRLTSHPDASSLGDARRWVVLKACGQHTECRPVRPEAFTREVYVPRQELLAAAAMQVRHQASQTTAFLSMASAFGNIPRSRISSLMRDARVKDGRSNVVPFDQSRYTGCLQMRHKACFCRLCLSNVHVGIMHAPIFAHLYCLMLLHCVCPQPRG